LAFVVSVDHGTWPDTWPKELEPYRDQAQTVDGMHSMVYKIRFDKREDFEKAWPHILAVKSKGAPLILERSPSSRSVSGSTAETRVRIVCPPVCLVKLPGGKLLTVGPPWPDHIRSSSGELPEYVEAGLDDWIPVTGESARGFAVRPRVDVVLITDGKIIDLNRIPLPPDTPIIDRRFEERSESADAN